MALSFSATSQEKKITPIADTTAFPHVFYSTVAWQKIWHTVNTCSEEVGWLGTVEKVGNNYLIEDIWVPEQEVTGGTTEIEADAMAALALHLEENGIDSSKLRYWGHSHVNMAVSPSGQDENQTAEYLEHVDWFIRGIYNKKGDTKVDVFDMTKSLVYQKVDNNIYIPPMDTNVVTTLDATIKANVKKKVYVAPKPHYMYDPKKPVTPVKTAGDDIQARGSYMYDNWNEYQLDMYEDDYDGLGNSITDLQMEEKMKDPFYYEE